MAEDEEVMVLAASYLMQQPRRIWVPALGCCEGTCRHQQITPGQRSYRSREQLGEFSHLIKELKSYEDRFYGYFRMSSAQFNDLLSIIGGKNPKAHNKLPPVHLCGAEIGYLFEVNFVLV